MAVRTVFANESGNQPASQLDNMFGDVWNAATLSCTVTGTNALVFTPRTNVNLPTSYVPNVRIGFTAVATATGSVTAQLGSLTALNVYQPGGTQAGAGNIVINTYYELAYDANLNSGAGGFWLVSATAGAVSVAQPLQAGFKNLIITNTTATTPSSQLNFTADMLTLWNTSNGAVSITSFSVTVNANTSGANGLDTGSFATNSWYFIWAIYNPTTATAAGLLSLSSTAPTMPSGYTYKARYGSVRSNAAPAFQNFMQKGRRQQYIVGTFTGNALTAVPNIANGTAGTYSHTTPTFVTASLASFAPSTASEIFIVPSLSFQGSAAASVQIAPNISYGGTNTTTGNVPAAQLENTNQIAVFGFLLETTSIAWTSNNTGGAISILGYVDNI